MGGISGISNRIVESGIKKPINRLTKNRIVKQMCDDFRSGDPKKYGKYAIYSIVLKDGLGCVMYVWQSLHNKEIPDDKRKFVASLDLTNGGLMIATQLLMAKGMTKWSSKLFEKGFGKLFNTKASKACAAKIKQLPKYAKISDKQFDETFGKFKKNVSGFFEVFATLVASTVLAKRVIVPFIATPLADKVKGLMDKQGQNKTENK